MDAERLIEEVRKFPVLYDQTDVKYRNIDYKDKVWKTIAADLQAKGGIEECKKKWTSIRDQLRKTLQKRKTVSGQAAVRQHKYKYEDLLTFLLPHMAERETISNISYTQDNNEHTQECSTDAQEDQFIVQEEEEEQEEEEVVEETTQQESADGEPSKKTQGSETQNLIARTQHSQTSSADFSAPSNKKNTFKKPPLKRKLQREAKPQESASSQLMAYILAEKEAEKQARRLQKEKEVQNPVDAFLAGIAPALKSLHPLLFHQAKGRIFAVVQEFELKQLMNDERSHRFPESSFISSPTSVSTHPSSVENESSGAIQQLRDLQRDSENFLTDKQNHHPLSSPSSSSASEINSVNNPNLFFLSL